MTKSKLYLAVAKDANLTQKAAKEAVDTVFEEITRVLSKGDKMVVSGFGTFYVSKVGDKSVEPFGKKENRMVVKGHKVVNFRVGKPLKQKIW